MIQSFRDEAARDLFEKGFSRQWAAIQSIALRKLDQLEAALLLAELRIPPGNRLEALQGEKVFEARKNQSLRELSFPSAACCE